MLLGWLLKEVCPPQVPMKQLPWLLGTCFHPNPIPEKNKKKKEKKKKQHLVHPLLHSLTGPHMGNGTPFDLITPMNLGVHLGVQMAYSFALLKVKVLILNKGERVCVFQTLPSGRGCSGFWLGLPGQGCPADFLAQPRPLVFTRS